MMKKIMKYHFLVLVWSLTKSVMIFAFIRGGRLNLKAECFAVFVQIFFTGVDLKAPVIILSDWYLVQVLLVSWLLSSHPN